MLIEELEGKVPSRSWVLSGHNFSNPGYFQKILGTLLSKGSVYFYTEKLLQLLLIITHPLMDK